MLKEAPSYYTDFTPHIERVKFDHPIMDKLTEAEPITDKQLRNCQIMADYIGDQLLLRKNGICEWWAHEDFKLPDGKQMHPLHIERKILREQMRANYGRPTKYGTLPYVHLLNIIKMLFPQTDITPPLADTTYLMMGCFTFKRKYIHLIGSMDAGKSSSIARWGWAFLWVDGDRSFVVTSTPTIQGANMTIFGDFTELNGEMQEAHPSGLSKTKNRDASKVFPKCQINLTGRITINDNPLSKGGFVQHRALREGLAIGAKGATKDKRHGVGLYGIDEINKHENLADFEKDLQNASKQNYFLCATTQNPTDENNAGAQIAAPKMWGDWGYSTFDEVRDADPLLYPSIRSGIVYRMDGYRSVNIVTGKCVYPYLLKQQQIDQVIEEEGENSDVVWSQIRAMFSGATKAKTLITASAIQTSRADHDDYIIIKELDRYLACDFAHSGEGDKAVIGWCKRCIVAVHNSDNTSSEIEMLIFDRAPYSVKFVNNFYWERLSGGQENLFYSKFIEVGGNINNLTMGSKVTYEQQIALKIADFCKRYNIPKKNIVYDDSMMSDATKAMILVLGHEPECIPLKEKPIGFKLHNRPKGKNDTKELARNINSEALFLGANVIESKCVRGGENIKICFTQLSKRLIDTKTDQPVSKKIHKSFNSGKSPDEGDMYCYLVWKAHKHGFRSGELSKSRSDSGLEIEGQPRHQKARIGIKLSR